MWAPPSMSALGSSPPFLRVRLLRLFAVGESGVLVALAVLIFVFQALEPAFASSGNVRAILSSLSFLGIIAIGQVILLVGGEFDLSVGSTAGLGAIVSADLMANKGLPIIVSVIFGLCTGALVGAINGFLVVRFHVPAFIVTLGMLFVAQGATQVITNGQPVYPLPDVVSEVGQATPIFGMGWSILAFVILGLLADSYLRRTVPGRTLYAVGGNPLVASLAGVRVERYKFCAFITSGTLAALAGIFVMGNLGAGGTAIGQGWELLVIAGVVVGGVSLFGGTGSILGGLVGMLLLQVVQSGLVVIGVSPNWQTIAVGSIMILAVALDVWRRRLPSVESPVTGDQEPNVTAPIN